MGPESTPDLGKPDGARRRSPMGVGCSRDCIQCSFRVRLQDSPFQSVVKLSTSIVPVGLAFFAFHVSFAVPNQEREGVITATAKYDTSLPLRDMVAREADGGSGCAGEKDGCGVSPPGPNSEFDLLRAIVPASMHSAAGASIEQTVPGSRPPIAKVKISMGSDLASLDRREQPGCETRRTTLWQSGRITLSRL